MFSSFTALVVAHLVDKAEEKYYDRPTPEAERCELPCPERVQPRKEQAAGATMIAVGVFILILMLIALLAG